MRIAAYAGTVAFISDEAAAPPPAFPKGARVRQRFHIKGSKPKTLQCAFLSDSFLRKDGFLTVCARLWRAQTVEKVGLPQA